MTIDRRIYDLRAKLHACPELSGREVNTLNLLENFLRTHTTLAVERRPEGLLATHWEGGQLETLGFRADVDAIPCDGHARHGCGHDGHSAILCALALALEGRTIDKNLCFIFQPAEETGEGAKAICEAWPEIETLHRIYGLHNIPGHPLGAVLARPGCFACASRGFVVDVQGKPAHAAYPGEGQNPAALLCEAVLALPGMIDGILNGDPRLLMHTVIGLRVGGENFGMSASDGRLCLTLRGHREADIDALTDAIRAFIEKGGMTASYENRDVFPDTTNPPDIADEVVKRWNAAGLPVRVLDEPMRWSEDFGWYLKRVPGQFFGIGIGEDHPGLHTGDYVFDDRAIAPALSALLALL
ncbi:MAG: M20 metallopeptidase family protein [bacterium]